MKRKVLAVIILVVGICLIGYPIVGNIINVVRQNSVQDEYNSIVQQISAEDKEKIKNDAEEYNRKLANGELEIISTDEDSIDESFDDGSGYADALDVGSDILAIIKIPKIDIELPIYRGTNALTLEKGIGHLRNTSLPVGGTSSHCVLTGHTGMPSSALFTDISKLEEGDMFYIQYLDEIHAYKVDQTKIVEPTDSSDLNIVKGKDYITLLTCYPYGINSHRLLVRGERTAFNGEITFGKDGKIESITEKEVSSDILTETNDTPVSSKEKESFLDELSSSKTKVNVYGINISLTTLIIIITGIVLVIVAAILAIIISKSKKKSKKNTEDN